MKEQIKFEEIKDFIYWLIDKNIHDANWVYIEDNYYLKLCLLQKWFIEVHMIALYCDIVYYDGFNFMSQIELSYLDYFENDEDFQYWLENVFSSCKESKEECLDHMLKEAIKLIK